MPLYECRVLPGSSREDREEDKQHNQYIIEAPTEDLAILLAFLEDGGSYCLNEQEREYGSDVNPIRYHELLQLAKIYTSAEEIAYPVQGENG